MSFGLRNAPSIFQMLIGRLKVVYLASKFGPERGYLMSQGVLSRYVLEMDEEEASGSKITDSTYVIRIS